MGGTFPTNYINIGQLSKLKYTYLFGFKKPDLKDFSGCKELRKLWIYSVDIENLGGLSDLANLVQLDLENARKPVSLDGIDSGNLHLQTVHLSNCRKLRNADALANLPSLEQLRLYQIHELNSLNFLRFLNKLEN